jgi:hypothetical protein
MSPIQGRLMNKPTYVGANPYVLLYYPYRDCIISVPDIRIRASPYATKKPWRAVAAGQGVEKTMNEKGTKKRRG